MLEGRDKTCPTRRNNKPVTSFGTSRISAHISDAGLSSYFDCPSRNKV